MTTTDIFQKYPDYYQSHEETGKIREKIQTNDRYNNFNQTHFTAGDVDQFEKYRNNIGGCRKLKHIPNSNYWSGYNCLNHVDITNTFNYMFNKFKKGIFIKIKDGKLNVFLPFSKANYYNEWSEIIDTRNFSQLASEICKKEGYFFNPKKINKNTFNWYANDGLVRYEFPINEGDSNVGNLKNMLEELCKEEKIPDIEFFVNRRDFPLLKKNYTEPYENIWGKDRPLVSHCYKKYCPILSMVTNENFADVCIPNHNDWARVMSKEGKWFPKTVGDFKENFNDDWNTKIPTAIFRGSSTGLGVSIETNPRLKVAQMSIETVNDEDGIPLLNAGITKWNLRPRKLKDSNKLQTINPSDFEFGLVDYLSPEKQSGYKYVIHIEGHVESFRLSMELAMNSVVLMIKSKWKIWYSDKLKPWIHYVPVKEDLSDLLHQILWCKKNDEKCKIIAEEARKFYDENLSKKSILSEMKNKLVDLAHICSLPPYSVVKKEDIQTGIENMFVNSQISKFLKFNDSKLSEKWFREYKFKKIERTYNAFKAISEILKYKILKDSYINGDVITKNKFSKLELVNLGGYYICKKQTSVPEKKKEQKHEVFVSLSKINEMSKYIPNFSFVFTSYEHNGTYNTLSEYIKGITFFQYLQSKEMKLDVLKNIIKQVVLSLHMAYEHCGFVHYDITPWNIILVNHTNPVTLNYKTNKHKSIKIKSNIVPVIIDYGKSRVSNSNENNETYQFQDIKTFIITCVKTMIKQNQDKEIFNFMMSLTNFLSNTDLLPTKLQNAKQLRNFLKKHGKFCDLMNYNCKSNRLKHMDLFNFVNSHQDISQTNYFNHRQR